MNKHILIFVIVSLCSLNLFAVQNDSLCKDNFYEKALSDTGSHSKFIKINYVGSDGKESILLCNNFELYRALAKHNGLSFSGYKSLVKQRLHSKTPLTFKEHGQINIGYKVPYDRLVLSEARKGQMQFVEEYFGRGGVFDSEKHLNDVAIFAASFDLGILVEMIEGYYSIAYKANCRFNIED